MTFTAIATMITILAVVWGGFLLILVAAIVKERGKAEAAGSDSTSPS